MFLLIISPARVFPFHGLERGFCGSCVGVGLIPPYSCVPLKTALFLMRQGRFDLTKQGLRLFGA